jgi:hypothetical protein
VNASNQRSAAIQPTRPELYRDSAAQFECFDRIGIGPTITVLYRPADRRLETVESKAGRDGKVGSDVGESVIANAGD